MVADEVAYRLTTPVALGQGHRIHHYPSLLKPFFVFSKVIVEGSVCLPITAGIKRVLVKVTYEHYLYIAAAYRHKQFEVVSADILHFVDADHIDVFLYSARHIFDHPLCVQ